MSAQPLVSILMPAYNASQFIDAAIQSILEQTYPSFELIILDDGSTDDSAKKAAHWALTDGRVRALQNERNKGIVYSLNRLIQEVNPTSKYLARMDSDDISLPNRLMRQVNFLESNPEYAIVGGHNLIIDKDGLTVGIRRYPTSYEEIIQALPRFSPFSHPTVMIRRSVIEVTGGYDDGHPGCEDYQLWFRIALNYKVANLNEPLLKYRLTANQIKQTQLRRTIQQTLQLQKRWLFHPSLRSVVSVTRWCAMHGLLVLPESWILKLFTLITYKPAHNSDYKY